MSTILTSDWHFTSNPRDAYRFDFVPWLVKQIVKREVKTLVIAGDLTEVKDNHGAQLTNAIADVIARLALSCSVIIVRGNHDGIDADVPFFRFLQYVPNVRFVVKPSSLKVDELGRVLFLPHSTRPLRDWRDALQSKYDYCVAHATFAGTVAENGYELGGIPTNIFAKNAKVFSGDIHIPQKVGPVTYIGAPYHVDFGDEYVPRILHLDNTKVTSIKVPGPSKRVIEVNALEDLMSVDDLVEGDMVKVRFHLAGDDAKTGIPRDKVLKWAKDNKIVLSAIAASVTTHGASGVASSKKQVSDVELLHDFAQRTGLDEKTTKLGLRFVKGAAQ